MPTKFQGASARTLQVLTSGLIKNRDSKTVELSLELQDVLGPSKSFRLLFDPAETQALAQLLKDNL